VTAYPVIPYREPGWGERVTQRLREPSSIDYTRGEKLEERIRGGVAEGSERSGPLGAGFNARTRKKQDSES